MLPGILIKKKLQNNMKYFFCYFFVSITFIFYLNAQNGPFVFNGEIEFERKVNLYTLYKENPALLEIENPSPKIKVLKWSISNYKLF